MADSKSYKMFNESYWRIWLKSVDGVPFTDACINELVGASKEIEAKFTAAGKDKMSRALLVAIIQLAAYSQSDNPSDMLRGVAIRQSKKARDIAPHLYDTFAECLGRVVEKYDSKYTPEVGVAWGQVLKPGLEYMKSMYDK
jgi:hypothetical protein